MLIVHEEQGRYLLKKQPGWNWPKTKQLIKQYPASKKVTNIATIPASRFDQLR